MKEFISLNEAVERLMRTAQKPITRRFCRKMVSAALRSGKVPVKRDGIELTLKEKNELADAWDKVSHREN